MASNYAASKARTKEQPSSLEATTGGARAITYPSDQPAQMHPLAYTPVSIEIAWQFVSDDTHAYQPTQKADMQRSMHSFLEIADNFFRMEVKAQTEVIKKCNDPTGKDPSKAPNMVSCIRPHSPENRGGPYTLEVTPVVSGPSSYIELFILRFKKVKGNQGALQFIAEPVDKELERGLRIAILYHEVG